MAIQLFAHYRELATTERQLSRSLVYYIEVVRRFFPADLCATWKPSLNINIGDILGSLALVVVVSVAGHCKVIPKWVQEKGQ